ncbi:hypothetical protein PPACK8108_LOCUS9366 [Phakopsora pachyrhizi]|uniref:Uncharacterized protein n=1 Tax=Phakopsora pachyrhizi TaxID=170000 RepID=A0AAV0AWD5_PHAPC|nr:hypothetical protein PPACK8108_LOCUS9366 [Phakopsora pachyrhizi]
MSYTDEVQLQHFLNLGALVDSPLYDFYKRYLETEPGEEEPQVPSATELCSPLITTTQAAEIEAPSDSVSKTLKHQLSHQSIQNPLPPTKRHSKKLQALPKTPTGRVLQGFQSSYSLRNPTGQGLIPQGVIPISAKYCEFKFFFQKVLIP